MIVIGRSATNRLPGSGWPGICGLVTRMCRARRGRVRSHRSSRITPGLSRCPAEFGEGDSFGSGQQNYMRSVRPTQITGTVGDIGNGQMYDSPEGIGTRNGMRGGLESGSSRGGKPHLLANEDLGTAPEEDALSRKVQFATGQEEARPQLPGSPTEPTWRSAAAAAVHPTPLSRMRMPWRWRATRRARRWDSSAACSPAPGISSNRAHRKTPCPRTQPRSAPGRQPGGPPAPGRRYPSRNTPASAAGPTSVTRPGRPTTTPSSTGLASQRRAGEQVQMMCRIMWLLEARMLVTALLKVPQAAKPLPVLDTA